MTTYRHVYLFESDAPLTQPYDVTTYSRIKDVPGIIPGYHIIVSGSNKKPTGLLTCMTYGRYDIHVGPRFAWTYAAGRSLLESVTCPDPAGQAAINNALEFLNSNQYGEFSEYGIEITVSRPE